ncbi:hypothetical protein ABBQ32_006122 [Trebouxia sp. C0010 RCD-2024]
MLSKSTAGAVQQSSSQRQRQSQSQSQSQSQGARGKGRANSRNFFFTGTALCCVSLCRWLHWKQRFADFSGSVQVTGKLRKAASFCGLMSKALLLLGYCFAAESGYYA